MLPKDCEHHLMWVYTIQMTLDKTTYFCKKKKKLNQNQPVNVMFVYDYICNSMYKMAISAVYIHIGLSNILTFIHEKTVHWKNTFEVVSQSKIITVHPSPSRLF